MSRRNTDIFLDNSDRNIGYPHAYADCGDLQVVKLDNTRRARVAPKGLLCRVLTNPVCCNYFLMGVKSWIQWVFCITRVQERIGATTAVFGHDVMLEPL